MYKALCAPDQISSKLREVVGAVRLRGGQPLYFQWKPDTEGQKLELQAHGDAGRSRSCDGHAQPGRLLPCGLKAKPAQRWRPGL
jgi:hypothetical protein